MRRRNSSPEVADGRGSLRDQTISGFFWTLSGTGTRAVLRIIVLVVLARLVAPNEFGVMSAALVVVGFSAMFSQLGVGPALVQRANLSADHVRVGLTASILMSLILGGLIAGGAPLVAAFFSFEDLTPVLRVLALEFPLQGMSVVARALLQREMRFRSLALIDVLSYSLGYGVLGITLGAFGLGVWALVLAHLATSVIATCALLVTGRHSMRPGWDRRAFGDLMRFGGGFTIGKMLNYLALEGDNIVAGRGLGATALGVYGRAFQLVAFPVNQFNQVVDGVLFPAMARIQQSRDRLSLAFRRGATIMAVIFAPIGATAGVLAHEIVMVVLGSRWLSAVEPLRILALSMLFRAGYQVSDTLARATGAVYRRAWRQAAYALAVVVGSWVGQRWGLEGLAIGVATAQFTNYLLMSHLSISLTSLTWKSFLQAHLPGVWVGGTAFLVVGGVASGMRHIGMTDFVTLLASGGSLFVVTTLLIVWRPALMGPDRDWMTGVVQQFFGRRLPAGVFDRFRGAERDKPLSREGDGKR